MKTINIDDDIYEHIAKSTNVIGESASDILRRLLGVGQVSEQDETTTTTHELSEALSDKAFPRYRNLVSKFLYLLGVVHSQKKSEFNKVLNSIQGRGRKYFASSRQEITDSGNSTQPKQIPDSTYWVMTNSPSSHKVEMLRQVLELLNYSDEAKTEAMAKLRN